MQDFKNVRSDMFIGVIAHERMFYNHDIKTKEGIGWKECGPIMKRWDCVFVCNFPSELHIID